MDVGDVWSVAAYGGDGAPRDNKIFDRIMLRFRPIAPKPVAGSSSPAAGASQASTASLPAKRTKRKYVRIRRNNGYVRKNGNNNKSSEKVEEREDSLDNVAVVTLQLMPEKDAPDKTSLPEDSWCKNADLDLTLEKIQILDNPKLPCVTGNSGKFLDLVPSETAAKKVVESWVTVESVTGTCMSEGGEGLGLTDEEKVKSLESDTCPGFVTDACGRVRWVNDAYKRMLVSSEEQQPFPENMAVWLSVKDGVAWCYSYPSFTCGVRLQYTWRNEKCTKMVPCDLWRLDSGGFAWKLDVKAALSLGL